MKIKNLFLVLTLICITSAVLSARLKLKNKNSFNASFSFYNSEIGLNGANDNNFKGFVSLDKENRGVVLSINEDEETNSENTNLLRLVGEKVDTESYLIDYRLMRSCNFGVEAKNSDNLLITFSPLSLENRKQNDNFEIKLDIFNYKTFFKNNNITVKDEQEFKTNIQNLCEKRKNDIKRLKTEFIQAADAYRKELEILKRVNSQVKSDLTSDDKMHKSVKETEDQIQDIQFLIDSYNKQLNSIKSLMNGNNRIIKNETDKLTDSVSKRNELEDQVKKIIIEIENLEEKQREIKLNYEKRVVETKDIENNIINLQKENTEIAGGISSVSSKELKAQYEINSLHNELKEVKQQKGELEKDINRNKKKNQELLVSINNNSEEKIKISTNLNKEKLEIAKIEEQINNLILEKSKREGNLKSLYDKFERKEEEISGLRLQNNSIDLKIQNLTEKVRKIDDKIKNQIEYKMNRIKTDIEEYKKKESTLNKSKSKIEEKIQKNSENKEKIQKEANSLQYNLLNVEKQINKTNNNYTDLLARVRDTKSDIGEKEIKLEKLKSENNNYELEENNVKKSLETANNNLKDFRKIYSDYTNQIGGADQAYSSSLSNEKKLQGEIKSAKETLTSRSSLLKRTTPSATIIVDMAEDDVLNNSDNSKDNRWKNIIEKIIS